MTHPELDSTLAYTPEVAARTAPLLAKLEPVLPDAAFEWPAYAPLIDAINTLKRERRAVVLAHNYQSPEIYHTVADVVGDSLALAQAVTDDAEIILMCGVHFMAETAKLLNPDKRVLIPDLGAGCSLASSITARDVRLLKERYPGVPVVSYVNTSAAVKAESDICCTSANVVEIVEALEGDTVLVLPDRYLAAYAASRTRKRILSWTGTCEVHERFTASEVRQLRALHPGAVVLAHPECPQDVLEEADFVGSTTAMGSYLDNTSPRDVVLITECSMSSNLQVVHPEMQFIKPCQFCPHMKRITLKNIYSALRDCQHEVVLPADVVARARAALERMLALSRPVVGGTHR